MAYKDLVSQAVASNAEVFKRVRDFICNQTLDYSYAGLGIGWTYWDSSYASSHSSPAVGDWFVIQSSGESGNDDLYFKFTFTSTTYFTITQYQYWNASTHVGVNGSAASNNFYVTAATTGPLWVYGNLDFCVVICTNSGAKYFQYFGSIDSPVYDKTITISSSAVAAGSSVAVTLNSVPSSWYVGGRVLVHDNANMERIIVSNISGNVVTFTSIAASYAANCKFAVDFPVVHGVTVNNTLTQGFYEYFSHTGVKMAATSTNTQNTYVGAEANPDGLNGDYIVTQCEWGNTSPEGYLGSHSKLLASAGGTFTDGQVLTNYSGQNFRNHLGLIFVLEV